jgi:hypothetical protein
LVRSKILREFAGPANSLFKVRVAHNHVSQ